MTSVELTLLKEAARESAFKWRDQQTGYTMEEALEDDKGQWDFKEIAQKYEEEYADDYDEDELDEEAMEAYGKEMAEDEWGKYKYWFGRYWDEWEEEQAELQELEEDIEA